MWSTDTSFCTLAEASSSSSLIRSKSFVSATSLTSGITAPSALINCPVLLRVRPSSSHNIPFSSTLSMSTSTFSASKQVVSEGG
ncbi:hypothetical protein F2Q68_00025579 [Brassica cretica]|uniref:Uncharacterized protein n=1 Tax=Brassica cretica TaxID=69181 RepID=A0A8S9I8R9_BRACR|nr:hypothetical protein F2Q68_00025579 [Brassica cretica]